MKQGQLILEALVVRQVQELRLAKQSRAIVPIALLSTLKLEFDAPLA